MVKSSSPIMPHLNTSNFRSAKHRASEFGLVSDKFRCFLLVFSFALIFRFDTDFVVIFANSAYSLCPSSAHSARSRPSATRIGPTQRKSRCIKNDVVVVAGMWQQDQTQYRKMNHSKWNLWLFLFSSFIVRTERWCRQWVIIIITRREGNTCNKNYMKSGRLRI